jgi:hypothetical protein
MTQAIATVMDRIEADRASVVSVGSKANSLEFLQAIYRNPSLALPVRMRAAIAALPHEVPRLAVTAVVTEQDFATLLEQRIKNYERIQNGTLVEAKSVPQIEAKPVKPHVADRRYRRI